MEPNPETDPGSSIIFANKHILILQRLTLQHVKNISK